MLRWRSCSSCSQVQGAGWCGWCCLPPRHWLSWSLGSLRMPGEIGHSCSCNYSTKLSTLSNLQCERGLQVTRKPFPRTVLSLWTVPGRMDSACQHPFSRVVLGCKRQQAYLHMAFQHDVSCSALCRQALKCRISHDRARHTVLRRHHASASRWLQRV